MRNAGDLFRFCLTEGPLCSFSDLGSLTSIAQIPVECEIVLQFKAMLAWNKRDGNRNHTRVQITPTQGCELITTGLIPYFSYPNKLRKASQNRKNVFFQLCGDREENAVPDC